MIEQISRFFSFQDANIRYVLFGSIMLGAAAGVLGSFAVLRKRSLLGDALAHAALPGVCIAFLLTGTKSILPLLAGATVSGVLGVLLIQAITSSGKIKSDSAIGIVLSVFFGIGIVLLTHIQRLPLGNQSGLDKFLFGQAASMLPQDLLVMGVISLFLLGAILLLFKEFRLLTFDPDFLATLGFPVMLVDLLLMALIVLSVMAGLQAVGVILMAAILITPAVAARFWTNHLSVMIAVAGGIGALSGFFGTFLSSLAPRIPTGPVMVLSATFFFILSAFLAPRKGVLAKWIVLRKNRIKMAQEHFLRGWYEIVENKAGEDHVSIDELAAHLKLSPRSLGKTGNQLVRHGLVTAWRPKIAMKEPGRQKALNLIKTHRLWEYYLIHRAHLEPDHVHRDADEVEHILSPQTILELERLLRAEGVDSEKVTSAHPISARSY
jgi:manganese/zinc/iron transport system permease protein